MNTKPNLKQKPKSKLLKPSFTIDRRMSAYHEAGHLTAALLLGLDAQSCIEATGAEPTIWERCVIGHTDYFPQATELDAATIGWAGLIAEEVCCQRVFLREDPLPTHDFERLWESYGVDDSMRDELSTTDQQHLGTGSLCREGFEAALMLLRHNCHELERNARSLIRSLPQPKTTGKL